MSHEQRAKLGKTPSESFTMLQQVYGEEMMSHACAFEWHKRFKEGREEVEDDPRSGKPSTSRTADNIERVKQMVRADRRLTVRMIAEELSINKDTVWSSVSQPGARGPPRGPSAFDRGAMSGRRKTAIQNAEACNVQLR